MWTLMNKLIKRNLRRNGTSERKTRRTCGQNVNLKHVPKNFPGKTKERTCTKQERRPRQPVARMSTSQKHASGARIQNMPVVPTTLMNQNVETHKSMRKKHMKRSHSKEESVSAGADFVLELGLAFLVVVTFFSQNFCSWRARTEPTTRPVCRDANACGETLRCERPRLRL